MSALKNINNEQILNILRNQDHTTVTILSSLLSVQDEIGYLPKNSINVIADFMNVTTNDQLVSSTKHPMGMKDPRSHLFHANIVGSSHRNHTLNEKSPLNE